MYLKLKKINKKTDTYITNSKIIENENVQVNLSEVCFVILPLSTEYFPKTVTVESTQTYEKIKEIIEEEAGYPVCEDKPSCCGSKAV